MGLAKRPVTETEFFTRGSAVIANNPAVAAARALLKPPSNQLLGFTIAAGPFGSLADGGRVIPRKDKGQAQVATA
jgi:hypothetical protein